MKLHPKHIVDAYKDEIDSVKYNESLMGDEKIEKDLVVRVMQLQMFENRVDRDLAGADRTERRAGEIEVIGRGDRQPMPL